MAWSENRPPLPPDWERRRQRVFTRDGRRCRLAFKGICTGRATEVDHIGSNDDHSIKNLRAVCHDCHRKRTQDQAAEAQRALWAKTRVPRIKHPGLL